MPVNTSSSPELGWKPHNFNLISVDNKHYSLDNLKGINGTVVVFICNHCPYVKSIAHRLTFESNELKKIKVSTIAIMSNDTKNYPEDSFDNMKIFSNKYKFDFQYLYDPKQKVAKNFNAICTPDFYGFNKFLELQYRGRIGSAVSKNENQSIKRDLYNAMKTIVDTNKGPSVQINSIGCSIKWKSE